MFEFGFSRDKGDQGGTGLGSATEFQGFEQGRAIIAASLFWETAKGGAITKNLSVREKTASCDPDERIEPMEHLK
jgi:hypothetical protein